MKKLVMFSMMLALLVVFSSCSKKADLGEVEVNVPSWFANPPSDENHIYGIGMGKSKNMQIAINKAKQEATVDIAKKLEQKVMAMTKKFAQEVGDAEDPQLYQMFEEVSKSVVSQTLNGVQVKEQKIMQNKKTGTFVVYMLMEMPLGKLNKALYYKIQQMEALKTKLEASKSFKELEQEVQKLESQQ